MKISLAGPPTSFLPSFVCLFVSSVLRFFYDVLAISIFSRFIFLGPRLLYFFIYFFFSIYIIISFFIYFFFSIYIIISFFIYFFFSIYIIISFFITLYQSSLLFSTYALQLSRLIVRSGLDFSTFATRRLHACHHARAPSGGRWNCGREMSRNFA